MGSTLRGGLDGRFEQKMLSGAGREGLGSQASSFSDVDSGQC